MIIKITAYNSRTHVQLPIDCGISTMDVEGWVNGNLQDAIVYMTKIGKVSKTYRIDQLLSRSRIKKLEIFLNKLIGKDYLSRFAKKERQKKERYQKQSETIEKNKNIFHHNIIVGFRGNLITGEQLEFIYK